MVYAKCVERAGLLSGVWNMHWKRTARSLEEKRKKKREEIGIEPKENDSGMLTGVGGMQHCFFAMSTEELKGKTRIKDEGWKDQTARAEGGGAVAGC